MKHIPHLVCDAVAWEEDRIPLSTNQVRHLSKVLRLSPGASVSYTDGRGLVGSGLLGPQQVDRGSERTVDRPSELVVAVAPPGSKERQRFLVEKLAELGVARMHWLSTRFGLDRPVDGQKSHAWAVAAVEQSRGGWLMETAPDLVGWDDLEPPIVVCDQTGTTATPPTRTVVIGPEGGWAEGEVPENLDRWSLGSTVLRTETAAVISAARLLPS